MINILKKKKGIEGGGFGVIIVIVIILLSAGVILLVIQSAASKTDEKTRIDICRISNEIRVGTESKSPGVLWFIHTPRICDTIYKTTSKLQIPSKLYKESYTIPGDAAKAEIGDMLKNCWYMWLEGSDKHVFELEMFRGRDGCHICYVFTIKNEAKLAFFDNTRTPPTFDGYGIIKRSLQDRTFFARDSSNKCAPNNMGGFLRENSCPQGEKEVLSKITTGNEKCCIKESNLDECGNKGGCCKTPGSTTSTCLAEVDKPYSKWSCPLSNQLCYVKTVNHYSYWDYITRYGKRGGTVVEVTGNDINPNGNGNFVDNVGAISVYSGDKTSVDNAYLRISSLDYARSRECAIV